MSNNSTPQTIQADVRSDFTSRTMRQLRRDGKVLGTIYGRQGNTAIAFPIKSMPTKHTTSQTLTIEVGGAKKTVLMREVQMDVISTLPVHVDFQEVTANDVVNAVVPVEFTGLTKEQEKESSFKVLRRNVEVRGTVSKLPAVLSVTVDHLASGESLHTSDLKFPDGVRLRAQKPYAIASLVRL